MKTLRAKIPCAVLAAVASITSTAQIAPTQARPNTPTKVIIDTDVGDDIDDAFAITLALRSPELRILGFTTAFGDTTLRARLLDRLLADTGHTNIPVAVGLSTPPATRFTQKIYAEQHHPIASHPSALNFLSEQIARYPHEITLLAIGPLTNIGPLIDRDPTLFRSLKQVVIMGGSVRRGYSETQYGPAQPPSPEWNILNDIPSANKLLAAGVPVYILPLDATQLKLEEVERTQLFRAGNPYTDNLTLLYTQWGQLTPTLFDPMTIAWLLDPALCPMQPMHLSVDAKGYTREQPGPANANVCLHSNAEAFFNLLMERLTAPAPQHP